MESLVISFVARGFQIDPNLLGFLIEMRPLQS